MSVASTACVERLDTYIANDPTILRAHNDATGFDLAIPGLTDRDVFSAFGNR
jgi:hypothetical protein